MTLIDRIGAAGRAACAWSHRAERGGSDDRAWIDERDEIRAALINPCPVVQSDAGPPARRATTKTLRCLSDPRDP